MNILAIDTTTKSACVAIQKNNNGVNEIIQNSVSNEITHSEKLLPLINKTLEETSLSLKDIDMYACINGPGSFTGIRIGLATIKAFSQVTSKDIFTISSLEALAYNAYITSTLSKAGKTIYIASLIDAKNTRAYFSLYKISKTLDDKIIIEKILNESNEKVDLAVNKILETFKKLQGDLLLDSSTLIFATNTENVKECINLNELYIKEKNTISILYPTTKDILNLISNLKDVKRYIKTAYTLDALYARLSQAERIRYDKD